MKKIILAAIVAVLSLGASAQGLRLGVQAFGGLNSVNDDVADYSYSAGGGLVLEYGFNENLYLGSGLNYQNKTWNHKALDKRINTHYITLPIHIGYRFDVTDAAAIHFQAGPQLAYGVAGTKRYALDGKTVAYDFKDWRKPFEVGVGLKIGTELNKKVQVNLSTNYGLTKTAKALSPDEKNWGNNLDFNLGVAYMFK